MTQPIWVLVEFQPIWKICGSQIGFIFPKFWGEKNKYLKPPPSIALVKLRPLKRDLWVGITGFSSTLIYIIIYIYFFLPWYPTSIACINQLLTRHINEKPLHLWGLVSDLSGLVTLWVSRSHSDCWNDIPIKIIGSIFLWKLNYRGGAPIFQLPLG